MNRLLALVVVASLGTGCIVSDTCEVRTVRITWDSFLRADGSTTSSCAVASLGASAEAEIIDVWIDGVYDGSAYCDGRDGGRFWDVFDVGPGRHNVTVEARDVDDFITLRDEFSFDAPDACGDLQVDSQPAEGWVSVNYNFYDGAVLANPNACVTGSSLWLQITDDIAEQPAYSITSTTAGTPACTASRNLRLPLAIGDYTFDWLEERSGSTLESSACTAQRFTPGKSFSVGRAATTAMTVALDTIGPACH